MITQVRVAFASSAVLLASLALAGPLENFVMAQDGKTVTVTEKDSGEKVALNKGDVLVVKLNASSGTGFTWKIAKNDGAVLPLEKEAIEKPEKAVPGGPITYVFRFKTGTAGNSDLELNYARAFEKDKAPAKTFRLRVTAQ